MDAQCRILFVEDNDDHAELLLRTVQRRLPLVETHRVCDGEEALDYLFRRGQYSDESTSPRPKVIVLDLHLPKLGGLEVLTRIKEAEPLKRVPVVILSSSASDQDVSAAYDRFASSYLVKPWDFDAFIELATELGRYWLQHNQSAG